jgi:2-aminoadipate transaminase
MEKFLSRDARNFRPSAIRAFAKLINDPNVISFAGGVPSPETFPAERIAEIAARVIRENRAVALQYGPTRGLPRLCDFVAGLCRSRGIDCSAADVLMTTGSQQALDLIAHTILDPGDVVLVELPQR